MKRVQIRVGFGDNWETLTIGFETVTDFLKAIAIVRASGIQNVFLRQITSRGIEEWDNL
jgi:hypothetical protein